MVALALCAPAFRSDAVAARDIPVPNPIPASYNALTRLALTAVGQQQGECFPWMRRVVQAATGVVITTDYRLGYLQAGAIEVTPAAAQNGDIIQIANDANTAPAADYPGLHTTFILENQGGGKYEVVDSNSNYDGIVRVRDQYDPAASAARYPGVTFHIYRLPARATGAPAVTPPASLVNTPGVIPIGSTAVIAADGDCLRVRSIAGLSGAVTDCLPTGARVTVTQPGPNVDGYHWVTITTGAITGWASEQYLRASSGTVTGAAAPPVVSTPAPAVRSLAPPSARSMYIVQPGDTLYSLAEMWRTPPFDIVSANNIADPSLIQVGQILIVPGASSVSIPAASVPSQPSRGATYAVQVGDSLSSLGSRWNTTTEILAQLNGMTDPNALQAGQVLTMPGGASVSIPAASVPSQPSRVATYTVQAGDSLSSLASLWNTTVDRVAQLNSMTDPNALQTGQVLTIPGGTFVSTPGPSAPLHPSPGATYAVQAGDSLSSLAVLWNTTADSVAQLNAITDPNALQVGQFLKRP